MNGRGQADAFALAHRVATMLSYGTTKQDVVAALRRDGHSADDALLAIGAAKVMIGAIVKQPPCGYCGSTAGFDRGPDGWDACRNCGGV